MTGWLSRRLRILCLRQEPQISYSDFNHGKGGNVCAELTCGAGRTSLLLFFVNSDTPLVCRMAEGKSDSFFFLIFCLSFFRSRSSFSLYTRAEGVIKKKCPFKPLDYLQLNTWPRSPPEFSIQMLLAQSFEVRFQRIIQLHGRIVEALCGFLFKRDLSIIVDTSLLLALLLDVDACSSQLPALLKCCQTTVEDKRENSEDGFIINNNTVRTNKILIMTVNYTFSDHKINNQSLELF